MPPSIFARPLTPADFTDVAGMLLNGCDLVVAGIPCRLVEIEFYLHSSTHPDPFVHRDPRQLTHDRWYLHRRGGTLRNGTFKGLDLTCGDGTAFGGILFRGLKTPGGMVFGPCLTVNFLLAQTGLATIAQLAAELDDRSAWDQKSPLFLRELAGKRTATLCATPRVGLKPRQPADHEFAVAQYRFLNESRSIRKGRTSFRRS